MKCRLPKPQVKDFLAIIPSVIEEVFRDKKVICDNSQVFQTEQEYAECLREIFSLAVLLAPHIDLSRSETEDIAGSTVVEHINWLLKYVNPSEPLDSFFDESWSLNIDTLLSVWWPKIAMNETLDHTAYRYALFAYGVTNVCALSQTLAGCYRSGLKAHLSALPEQSEYVTGGAIAFARVCTFEDVLDNTLVQQLLSADLCTLPKQINSAADKRRFMHYLSGKPFTPDLVPVKDLNSAYIHYLQHSRTCSEVVRDAYHIAVSTLVTENYTFELKKIKSAQETLVGTHKNLNSSYDYLKSEHSTLKTKNSELRKALNNAKHEIVVLQKELKIAKASLGKVNKQCLITQPEVTQPLAGIPRKASTFIIERQRIEISKLSDAVAERDAQISDLTQMVDSLMNVETDSITDIATSLTEDDYSLLKQIRAHLVVPDFKASKFLQDYLPGSTFTFVPKSSIGKLVVPKSKEIYLFCTSHAGHAVYESWYRQVTALAAPHVVFENSNTETVCKIILKHYKEKVLHI